MKVSSKLVSWKGKSLARTLSKKVAVEGAKMIAKDGITIMKAESPVLTGNLRDSHTMGKVEEKSDSVSIEIGPDEDKAPYSKFVYYVGETRNYAGNNWPERAMEKMEGKKSRYINSIKTLLKFINI